MLDREHGSTRARAPAGLVVDRGEVVLHRPRHDTTSEAAIALLDSPWAVSRRTSTSRSVRSLGHAPRGPRGGSRSRRGARGARRRGRRAAPATASTTGPAPSSVRMQPDALAIGRAERAGAVPDRAHDARAADVVQERGHRRSSRSSSPMSRAASSASPVTYGERPTSGCPRGPSPPAPRPGRCGRSGAARRPRARAAARARPNARTRRRRPRAPRPAGRAGSRARRPPRTRHAPRPGRRFARRRGTPAARACRRRLRRRRAARPRPPDRRGRSRDEALERDVVADEGGVLARVPAADRTAARRGTRQRGRWSATAPRGRR